jgi:hypothetical protein
VLVGVGLDENSNAVGTHPELEPLVSGCVDCVEARSPTILVGGLGTVPGMLLE